MEMKRFGHWMGFALPALAGMLPFFGCVAVDVGEPKVYPHTETHFDTATTPSAVQVEAARAQMNQAGTDVVVGIAADVREEFPKLRWEETATVRVQKRLGIGLFPGAAEVYLKPDGALDPLLFCRRNGNRGQECGLYAPTEDGYLTTQIGGFIVFGIPQIVGTVGTLLFEPFSGWSCGHDFVERDCMEHAKYANGMEYADATKSEKIRVFKLFTPEERKRMGVRTCYDGPGTIASMNHVGLIGCHKHQAVFVEPPKPGPRTETGEVETKRRRADVEGPYVVELSIPAMGHAQEVRVDKGAKRAEFALPSAERKCVAEAVLRFRAEGTRDVPEVTRGALEKVSGQEYRFDVTLQGGAAPAIPAAVPKAGGGAYEVVGITPSGEGKYEVRVRIADKTKTFDVGWAVEPDVKRMIREDFVKRHPGTGIQYVREMVEWGTEEDGAVLVYRGWAFSARPVSDGWAYDDGTRRGTVRLRISEGMPADEAKRWARENIEAIVKEKNVALEAGKAPPEGAMYRSLGEVLEAGVLTVEFEAVE